MPVINTKEAPLLKPPNSCLAQASSSQAIICSLSYLPSKTQHSTFPLSQPLRRRCIVNGSLQVSLPFSSLWTLKGQVLIHSMLWGKNNEWMWMPTENFHMERLLLLVTHPICHGGTVVCTHRLIGPSSLSWFLLLVFSARQADWSHPKVRCCFSFPPSCLGQDTIPQRETDWDPTPN